MKVAVIGAGVVGVTTAWELAADGHEVTVFERRGSVAAGGSFAAGGIVAPDYTAAWGWGGSSDGRRRSIDGIGDLTLGRAFDLRALAWKWRLSRRRSGTPAVEERASVLRLARASRERLRSLTRELRLDYETSQGCLLLLRSKRDLARARGPLSAMAEWGSRFSLVEPARCREIEPGLNPETPLHAGVHLPESDVGNCRQFANLLRAEAQRLGVRFCFHTQVCAVRPGAHPELDHVPAPAPAIPATSASPDMDREGPPTQPLPVEIRTERYDAVVVCAAQGGASLLRPAGLRLRMAPVWINSVTAPVRHHEAHPDVGPRSAVVDLQRQVTISRIGQRVRVAGSTEIGGNPDRFNAKSLDGLYHALDDWFPGATQMAQVQRWKGPQPRLVDGLPVLGASGLAGVWLNLGHGAGGWTLACGSARVVADAMAGRKPEIDTAGLDASRLR